MILEPEWLVMFVQFVVWDHGPFDSKQLLYGPDLWTWSRAAVESEPTHVSLQSRNRILKFEKDAGIRQLFVTAQTGDLYRILATSEASNGSNSISGVEFVWSCPTRLSLVRVDWTSNLLGPVQTREYYA
jgi:hypothetical protein